MSRFTVIAKTGHDFGHLAPRHRGVIGQAESLEEARLLRDSYAASHAATNSGAAFSYAAIVDSEDEHAVVGFGRYGDGSRITSIRPLESVAPADDVLFRGTRAACQAFQA